MFQAQWADALFIPFILLLLAFTLLTQGCGTPGINTAQEIFTSGAEVTQEFDEALAPIVTQHVTRCDEAHATREAFEECVQPLYPLGYGIALARRAAQVGQAAIDGWYAGANDGWDVVLPIIGCFAYAIDRVVEAIRMFGLDARIDEALAWVDTYGGYARSLCPYSILESAEADQ